MDTGDECEDIPSCNSSDYFYTFCMDRCSCCFPYCEPSQYVKNPPGYPEPYLSNDGTELTYANYSGDGCLYVGNVTINAGDYDSGDEIIIGTSFDDDSSMGIPQNCFKYRIVSNYSLSGYVFNSSGTPLANVPVELEDENWTIQREDTTDEDGYFELNVSQGEYGLYINEEEETDCGVRNKMDCHDIYNEADCENSYYEYCYEPGVCGLLEEECGDFPCFWGDIGQGFEVCYSSCSHCMLGVNQSVSDYTSIDFEEPMINLTGDLEINLTLLRIDTSLELLDIVLPRFIDVDFIESANISRISKFRSGFGHDYSDNFESCRSMKHYFEPKWGVDWSKIKIFSPVNGTITSVYQEWAGTKLGIRSTDYTDFTIEIFHINLLNPLNVGDNVAAGQQLGTHIGSQTMSDIAISFNDAEGWRLVSYFDVMTDELFDVYKARGIGSRDVTIISKGKRDSDPLTCVGETFVGSGNLEHWVNLGTQYPPIMNIDANLTITNNENFNLTNWEAFLEIEFENETIEEEIYFSSTLTNLSAGETKSYLSAFDIPLNNTYDKFYVYGGIENKDWNVVSSQGNITTVIYKKDEKEINVITEPGYVLSGYVFNSSGAPLANVPVELENETAWLEGTTNADGYFEFNVPEGEYGLYVNMYDNMDESVLEEYTEAEIGEYTLPLNVTSDIEINFTLWKINVNFETNTSEYHNGDIIEVNVTVENNEIYNITDWEVGADLYFWNETDDESIEDSYPVNISSGEKKSFLVYLQIPVNIVYDNWNLWGWVWKVGVEFESSKGPIQGEIGKEEVKEINIITKTGYVLSGYVFDTDNQPLANVPVELENENWTIQREDTTDEDGYFELNVPPGEYELYINMEDPILEGYTEATIGEDTPPLNLISDIQINFTLWKINVSLETDSSNYHKGDTIEVNVTVENNEIYNITDWDIGADMYFWNATYGESIEDYYPVNISSGEKKSFLLYLNISENAIYGNWNLWGWVWKEEAEFESSKGPIQGEMGKEEGKKINIGTEDDADGDGIPDEQDNCPLDYNPQQGNTIYAYDDFNDNFLSSNWYEWKSHPDIIITETNQEIRINGTTVSSGLWNTLQFTQDFNQDVEASIRVRTPVIDENSGFSFIIRRMGAEWGYYRMQRNHWGYHIGGHLQDQEYWSGPWTDRLGDEETNFYTYKIIYEKSKQELHLFVNNLHLDTIENVNFEDFRFELGIDAWNAGAEIDIRVDNFTIKEIGDFDNDNAGDVCDNCPYDYNPNQEDSNQDGVGDVCEPVTISGYIFNTSGNPIMDVTVELEDATETMELNAITDENGYFEFIDVPKGYYELEANDDWPILLEYTGAGIGDYPPLLDARTDIQINFTLWKVGLSFETNTSEYHNGDTIEVNITVENNEIYNITNWEVGAELFFENETYWHWINESYYLVDVNAGETESFLVYLQIPQDNEYSRLYLEGFIWTDKEFKSSKGLLQGELWNWQELVIFIGEKTKFNISLVKGWNLVSVPLILPDPVLPAPFKSIEGNYSHGFTYMGGKWYDYYAGEPATDKDINPPKAFWINMTNDDVLEVEGDEWQNPEIILNAGWNLVGYPSIDEINIDESNLKDYTIFTYNSSWSSYIPERPFNSLQTLKPGYGYWVKKK